MRWEGCEGRIKRVTPILAIEINEQRFKVGAELVASEWKTFRVKFGTLELCATVFLKFDAFRQGAFLFIRFRWDRK